MKTFICIMALAVVRSKAGYETHEQEDSGHNSSPQGGFGYSSQVNHDSGEKGGLGNGFSGAINSYGHQGQDFSGAQPHSFGGDQNHDNTVAQPHSFAGSSDHNFGSAQGHNSVPTYDFTAPILQHLGNEHYQFNGYGAAAQPRGYELGGLGGHSFSAPSGHDFQADSYLQAAHDLGLEGNGGHDSGSETQGYSGGQSHDEGQQQGGYGGGQTHQGFLLQDGGHEFGHGGEQNTIHDGSNDFHDNTFAVGEHTDVESPVQVPQYKHVTYPIPRTIHVNVPKPILVGVPQPYPVKIPVHKPVAVPVETEISIPMEKVVPYPVVKHVPYPVEKHVPIKVEKTVTVHVPQPYPVKIPVYKTIHHYKNHH